MMTTRFAISAALAAVVGACAQGSMVQNATIGSYQPSMLNYAASQGAMKVDIIGNPFDGPKEDLERVVTGELTRAHFGPALDFATSVSPDNRSPYRVVLVFNPASDYSSGTICDTPGRATEPSDDRIRVKAAFCSADRAATYTAGRVPVTSRPSDARFRQLIRQLGLALFPLRDPTRGDDEPEKVPF